MPIPKHYCLANEDKAAFVVMTNKHHAKPPI